MKFAFLPFVCLVASCLLAQDEPFADQKSDEPVSQQIDHFKVLPDPAGKDYFPKDKASFYTRYLSAMKEPSVMAELEKGVERVFRFTYLRSFDDPLVVRIVDTGDAFTVRVVRLKMDRDYNLVKIVKDKTWKLHQKNRKLVLPLLDEEDFWKPLNDMEEALMSGGKDGAMWIFETHNKEGYRMLDIWSPGALPPDIVPGKVRNFLPYRKAGETILKIGKILPEPNELY